jgi:hypothetical protein
VTFAPSQEAAAAAILPVAAGAVGEDGLACGISDNLPKQAMPLELPSGQLLI